MNITKEDALWLLNDYNKIRLYGKVGQWINQHTRAFSILKGKEVSKPDCTCQYVAFSQLTNSIYEQYEEQIKQVAYADERETPTIPVTETRSTRGRKKDTGA